jgi:hypothetical protein
MKLIKLSDVKCKKYSGRFNYLIIHDFSAEKANRYSVFILNSDDPVVIGRELPLSSARFLIKKYEELALKSSVFLAERKSALKIRSLICGS